MFIHLIMIIGGAVALAAVFWLAGEGFRNGDRPDDALVGGALRSSGQPGEERPVAIACVRNLSEGPVLAALAVRRALLPGWLAGTVSIAVPRRTARRAFRPGGYPAVGIVPGTATAELTAPVSASARRYLLTVLVGQAGGRLRVHRLRLETAQANGRRTDRLRGVGTSDVLGPRDWARD